MKTQSANFGQDVSYKEAEQRIKSCRETGGKALDLSGLGLCQIPPELAELTNLTELSLSGNSIKNLPGFIGSESFKLTDKAKKELFAEINHHQRKVSKEILEAASLVEKKTVL
jgi:Leucine-rich repeat (LRR) protein